MFQVSRLVLKRGAEVNTSETSQKPKMARDHGVSRVISWRVLCLIFRVALILTAFVVVETGWAGFTPPSHCPPVLPSTPTTPTFPTLFGLPTDFAPPGFNSTSTTNAERDLTSLLRNLDGVQTAYVVVNDLSPAGRSVQIVIKPRARPPLAPAVISSLLTLATGCVPDLTPEHVTVLDTSGRTLIERGKVLPEEPPSPAGSGYALGLLISMLIAGIGWAMWAVRRTRKPTVPASNEPFYFLGLLQPAELAEMLAQERPEVRGLILSSSGSRLRGRLYRHLRRRHLTVCIPLTPPEPRVIQIIAEALATRPKALSDVISSR